MVEFVSQVLPWANLTLAVVTLLVFALRVPSRFAVMEWKVDQLWRWYAEDHRHGKRRDSDDADLG